MSDDNSLKSFKIAETKKPTVKSSATKTPKPEEEAKPENGTLGFARIEALLDQESPEHVQANLTALLDSLTNLETTARTPKAKAGVKRAKLAVERTQDLLTYLFKTKEAMQAAVEATVMGPSNGKK